MKEPIKLKPTVDRSLTSKEGLTIGTNSDYEFHKDVMEEDKNDNKDNHIENKDGKCRKCGKPVDEYELECEECIKKEILGEKELLFGCPW